MNNDRFKFRLPIYDNNNNFVGFDFYEIKEGGIIKYNRYPDTRYTQTKPDEQCTGLSDKNGKLIYEQDQYYNEDGVLCTVFYNVNMGMFEYKLGTWVGAFCKAVADNIEIIGNIHEVKE